jgi:transposase-like protein
VALTEAKVEYYLTASSENREARYPMISRFWQASSTQVSPSFSLPNEIGKAFDTSNNIELLNMSLKKNI